MESLKKSLELYALMLERLEKSGHAPHQVEYYKECIAFMETCTTGEEAREKMRRSHLYTGGGDALALDDVLNRKWAAEKREAPELVDVFSARYEEVKATPTIVFNTSNVMKHNRKVQEAEMRLQRRRDAFFQVFQGYLEATVEIYGTEEYEKGQIKLKGGIDKLEQLNKPFQEAATEGVFRNLLYVSDEGYRVFVDAVEGFMAGNGLPHSQGPSEDAQWEEVKAMKSQIMAVGRGELSRNKAGICFCESPKDATGKYEYSHFVEEV